MNYLNIQFENIEIPTNAEQTATKENVWKIEVVPGMFLNVWYAHEGMDKTGILWAVFYKEEGLKYGITIEFNSVKMQGLNDLIRDEGWKNWKSYLADRLPKNEIINASPTVDVQSTNETCYVFTSDKNELKVLLSETSKAINELASKQNELLQQSAKKALANENEIDEYGKIIHSSAETVGDLPEIASTIEQLLEKYKPNKLTKVLASAACLEALRPYLKKIIEKQKLSTANLDEVTKSRLFWAIQECVSLMYVYEIKGKATKNFLERYLKLLADTLQTFGFEIRLNGLETVVRTYANQAFGGTELKTYEADEKYDPEIFGSYDSEVWAKIDVLKSIS